MTVTRAQLAAPVALFLRWWLRELRACVPGSRVDGLAVGSRAVVIRMSPDQAIFHYWKGKTRREIGRLSLDRATKSFDRKQIARIRRRARARRTDVVLCLPPDCVLQRRVNLPLATQENLREVLGFEMERLTAFKADELYYSHRVVETSQAEKRIVVALVAAPRAIADRAIETAKDLGLTPNIVTPDGDDLAIDRTINLVPRTPDLSSGQGIRRLLAALSLVAMALVGAAVYLEFDQQARLLAAYGARLAESRAASLRAEELGTQVSTLLERGRYVVQRKRTQPLLIEVLDETTRLLPDNTWVTQFRLQKGQLTLSGHSVAASTLIQLLEASPMLTQVRFASPVTLDAKQGVERFNLSAVLVSKGDQP